MPDRQPETPDTDTELREFDLFLVEASPNDFEDFLENALRLLAEKSMDFLQSHKDLVNRRLAAEPEPKGLSMSHSHQRRICYWEDIADRFEAEINFRSGNSPKSPQDSNPNKSTDMAALNERERFVLPILKRKGWSTHQFAVEAEVDFHTANHYLKGNTKPNRSTLASLAKALNVPVEKLPK